MNLFILRPQPGADATAQKAKAAGIIVIKTPLFTVQETAWSPPDLAHYDAILFTSANALRHGGLGLKTLTPLPAYAVGEATAKLVRAGGFAIAATGKSGVDAALQLAAGNGHKRLLWLTGQDHSEFTTPDGMATTKQIVYQAQRLAAPEEMRDLLSCPAVVALHSARAAAYFAEVCNDWQISRQHIILACLSPAIAETAGDSWGKILVADGPNDTELISKVKSYFTSIANAP